MKYNITAKNGENTELRWNLSWVKMLKYKFAYRTLGWYVKVTESPYLEKWGHGAGKLSLWKY